MTEGASPAPAGVTPNFEHPEDVLKTINMVAVSLVIGLMAFFVLLRLSIRVYLTRSMHKEDWVCLIAWLLATGYCMTGIFMGEHGGGNHQWEVTKENYVGFQQALYANTIVYGPAACFVKMTLLLMVANLFSPFKSIVRAIYVFMVFMVLYYLPVMIIKTVVCTPIAGFWDTKLKSKCFNQTVIFMTDTIMSAIMDFVILVLPVPITWSLNISFKKKLRIMAILGIGGVATLASIVRLIIVFQPHSFEDETLKFVRFNLLAVAEVGIGTICTCVPALASLYALWRKPRNPQNSGEVKTSRKKMPRFESQSTYIGSTKTMMLTESTGQAQKDELVTTCNWEIIAEKPEDGTNHVPVPQNLKPHCDNISVDIGDVV